MTIYEICKNKLENFPRFRERRFRGPLLARLACRELGLESKVEAMMPWSYEELDAFSKKHDSFRHEYDAVQRDYPHLRGNDYADGKILADEKKIEFGYVAGHHNDLRTLERLSP